VDGGEMVNIMEPGKPEKYPPLNPSPPKLKRKKMQGTFAGHERVWD
jgi:hypothetical protein